MRIYATNPIISQNPTTNLSSAVLSGVTTLPIYNNSGFSATTNLFLLSTYQDQQAEIVKSSATGNTSATLSASTLFPHAQDTQLTLMPCDQVEFSRSDDGGITWTVLATIPLQVDRLATVYTDNGGSSTSLWRFRFFNSLTSVYSSYSSNLGQSGYSLYQLEEIQNKIVSLFGDSDLQFLSYDDITDWINDCAEHMAGEVYMSDRMGLIGTLTNTFNNSNILTMPDDFVMLKRLAVSFDNGNTYYKATHVALDNSLFRGQQSDAQQQFGQTRPIFYRQDDQITVLPNNPSNPTNYQLIYYRLPTVLANPSDKLDLIFRPYTSMFIDYGMWRAKLKDKKPKDAAVFWNVFLQKKMSFLEQLTKWQLSEPETIDEDDFDDLIGGVRVPGRL